MRAQSAIAEIAAWILFLVVAFVAVVITTGVSHSVSIDQEYDGTKIQLATTFFESYDGDMGQALAEVAKDARVVCWELSGASSQMMNSCPTVLFRFDSVKFPVELPSGDYNVEVWLNE